MQVAAALDGRRALAFVFLVAALLRLLNVWQLHDAPVFDMRLGDTAVFDAWAREIAAGDWLGDEVFWYAPLYPYFLGVVYALCGDDGWAVRIVQAALGACSCVLIADATRRLFSERAGWIAGFGLAVYAPAVFYDGLIHKASLALFLLCLLLWLHARGMHEVPVRPSSAAVLGVVFGLLVLVRENTMVFGAVLLAWLAWKDRPWKTRRIAALGLFALGALLVLMPVGIRNFTIGGEWHLTAANFGDNFFKGNNAYTDGSYVSLVPYRGSPEFERQDAVAIAERERGRELTASEVSRFWTDRAVEFIRTEPGAWLRLMARKAFLVGHAVELADTEDLYTYATWSSVLRVTSPLFHMGVLLPLAVLGLFVTRDRWRDLWPWYLMLVAYPATVVVFYVFGRYRFPVVAILVPFAGAGLAGAIELLRRSSRRLRVAAVATVSLVAILANWPLDVRDRIRSTTLYNLGVWSGRQADRQDEAIGFYEAALRLHPDSPMALYNLGNHLRKRGDLPEAEARYREAIRSAPDLDLAHQNLGRCLEAQGRVGEAVEAYRRAAQIAPDNWEARSNLGLALARIGFLDEAIRALESAADSAPGEAVPRFNLGNVLLQAGRPAEAETSYRLALNLEPGDARIHNNLGYALVAQGRLEEAMASYREALRLDPDHAGARANLEALRQRGGG